MEALARHMRSAVTTYGHSAIELEWRLGHRHGSFRPGVDAAAWRRLRDALDASPAFEQSFEETAEKLGDGIKCISTQSTQPIWLHKKRLAAVDVDADADGPWTIRASVSLESRETAPPAQQAASLQYERRKKRWSYTHMCWRIDLTRVQTNLPSHLDEDSDIHEVEIELVDQGILFERALDNVLEWGWTMSRDLCKLMR